ncbi:MAG: O-antigen ligase family protein [Pseudomonadota bacterium]
MSKKLYAPLGHAPPAAEAQRRAALRQRCWTILLVLFTVQFTGAWLFPAASVSAQENLVATKVGGTPYQLSMWGLIVLAFIMHCRTHGFGKIGSALMLFAPFWVVGLLAGAFGVDPVKSLRSLIMFALAMSGAALIGIELAPRRAIQTLCWTLFGIMLASTLLALIVPNIGTQIYGFTTVWRGAFTNKNQLGWVAALAILIAVAMMRSGALRLSGVTALLALVCLLASGSKGALMAALATMAYVYVVSKLARHVTTGFGMGVLGFILFVAAIFGFLVLPYVLEALGRDMTLTGRTDVWRIYFNAMTATPWLGEGPAAYTTISTLTTPLASQLESLGAIVTPHNMYLGVFGDTGLFGLVCFLVPMMYLTAVVPLARPGLLSTMCASVGFLMLAHGTVETHEILAPGPGWFFLMLMWALLKQEKEQPKNNEPQTALNLTPFDPGSIARGMK